MTVEGGKFRADQSLQSKQRGKVYRRPELRMLGAVHLLTRGTGSRNGDGPNMMMT